MSVPDALFVGVLILITVIFFILGLVYHRNRGSNVPPSPGPDAGDYQNFVYWFKPAATDDKERNTCKLYDFPSKQESTEVCPGQSESIRGTPTLNPATLNLLPPKPLPTCYDVDQIVAIQAERTCTAAVQGATGRCRRQDGVLVPVGEKEVVYTQEIEDVANCDTPLCDGILGVYILGYVQENNQPPACTGSRCIQFQNGFLTVGDCSLGDEKQIQRINLGPDASSASDGVGPRLSLQNRKTGKYMDAVVSGGTGVITSDRSDRVWLIVPGQVGKFNVAPQQTIFVAALTEKQISSLVVSDPDKTIENIVALGMRSIKINQINSGTMELTSYYYFSRVTPPPTVSFLSSSTYSSYTMFNIVLFGVSNV